jgi:hypothetical protein
VRIRSVQPDAARRQASVNAGRLPLFLATLIGLAFLLLLAVFRSVLVAVKAAVLNLLSIIAAYGVIAYAAQRGWFGHLFGITTPTPIPAFIPMIMFAVLFGLSMDYEVFLLSRVREEYLRTRDNTTAVADGLAGTAKVITASACRLSCPRADWSCRCAESATGRSTEVPGWCANRSRSSGLRGRGVGERYARRLGRSRPRRPWFPRSGCRRLGAAHAPCQVRHAGRLLGRVRRG